MVSKKTKTDLEAEMAFNLKAAGLGGFVTECPFKGITGTRRYRFDLCYEAEKVAVEVQGGVFSGGRHVTGKGFSDERSKSAQAQILGWAYIEVTPAMIRSGEAVDLVRRALRRGGAGARRC